MSEPTHEHDPFCPSDGGVSPCHCELIAKVRKDQHERTQETFTHLLQMPALFFEHLHRHK